jgi:tetratricopeptide (TPR) repeat protein
LIVLTVVIVTTQFSYGAPGRRKHFFSHGPSVAAFGAGESLFSAYNDPAVLQINPSLMAFFKDNAVGISGYTLPAGSYYTSASALACVTEKLFFGLSAANLSSGEMEFRDSIYGPARERHSVNIWDGVLSAASYSNYLNTAYGLSFKFLSNDFKKGTTCAFDCGLSKNIPIKDILKIKVGLSWQNFVPWNLKTDKMPMIGRLSTAFIFPTYYRLKSKDTLNIYADLKYEDDSANFYGGACYIVADKYIVRAGYYPQHFTFGAGIDFYSFTLNYGADFSKAGFMHRLGLTYRWNFKKSDGFAKEVESALYKEQIYLKEAKEKFDQAKCLYNNKEYLRATDMLLRVAVLYPNDESPKYLYKEITEMMSKIVNNRNELDFGKITYARAYKAYYNADYKKASNEWEKYISFTGGSDEVNEYSKKINTTLKLEELKNRESELDVQSEKILKTGIEKYNLHHWVECIKIMEQLKEFTIKNNFSKTLEYHDKAKEYISRSVLELSRTMLKNKTISSKQAKKAETEQEKVEYDEVGADKKYAEGLVLYAQGKYYEAERSWEFALRLNPNHKKAKVALKKLKTE